MYIPADGSTLTRKQAQKYGDRITRLIVRSDGSITPAQVVKDARSKRSPLHDGFEWDDETAAEKWRLEQASYILRSIHVVVTAADCSEVVTVRAFQHVTLKRADDEPVKAYVLVAKAMNEDALRAQVLEDAHRQLLAWRKKYATYEEFAAVIAAIDMIAD